MSKPQGTDNLGFDSPIMTATDYVCLDCECPVYVAPKEKRTEPFCLCGKASLAPAQLEALRDGMMDGTLNLEEVF